MSKYRSLEHSRHIPLTQINTVAYYRPVYTHQHCPRYASPKGAFLLHRASGPLRTGPSRQTSDPLEMERKGLVQSALDVGVRPFVSQRQNEADLPQTSNSSTNQMVFHGVPSNVHSFSVSH